MAVPITEILEWHDATIVKPDCDMTVLCWIDDDFFCGYWNDSIPGWIACESGGSVIGVTHWATPGGPHGDHFRDGTKMVEPAERDEGAITQEQINEILTRDDHAFRAFVERFDPKCWARYDLSALHLGWHFGKGAAAPNDKDQKDAGRYRYLRAQHWSDNTIAAVHRPKAAMKLGHDAPSGERLDTLIDEAMAVPGNEQGQATGAACRDRSPAPDGYASGGEV